MPEPPRLLAACRVSRMRSSLTCGVGAARRPCAHTSSTSLVSGLDTRRELSRKLNVSARQVQVWFQNKRQRERKLSRSKGLLSTPGLPDTPAVAAKAAAARAAAKGVNADDPHSPADSVRTVPISDGESSESKIATSCSVPELPSLPPLTASNPGTMDASPALPLETKTTALDVKAAKLQGASMTRSVSMPEANDFDALLPPATPLGSNLNLSSLPLSKSRSLNHSGMINIQTDRELQRSRPASKPPVSTAHGPGFSNLPDDKSKSLPFKEQLDMELSGRPQPSGSDWHKDGSLHSCVHKPLSSVASQLASSSDYLTTGAPWLRATMSASSEQAAMHCRAAVAAAAAQMNGRGPTTQPPSVPLLGGMEIGGLAMNLLPQGSQSDALSANKDAASNLGSCGMSSSQRTSNSHRFGTDLMGMEPLDELAGIEIPDELQRELFSDVATVEAVPDVTVTPTTSQVLGGHESRTASSANATAGSDISSPSGEVLRKLRPLEPVPMTRTGCSGLLDRMVLDLGFQGDFGDESVTSDNASMETVGYFDENVLSSPAATPDSCRKTSEFANHPRSPDGVDMTYQAEPSDMSCEADRYVQVITSGQDPFTIVWASEAWLQLCEYGMGQVLGQTLEIIQGPLTTRTSLNQLMGAIRSGESVSLSMVNHTRTGKAFSHTLRVEALRNSSGEVQCFQATSSNIEFVDPGLQSSMHVGKPSVADSVIPETWPELSDSKSASTVESKMTRVSSDIQISEMLGLFDTSRGAVPSIPESILDLSDWQ